MRAPRRLRRWSLISVRNVLFAILITLANPVLAAVQCPLDQIVFKDAESGREFIAQRVAVDYQYLCDGNKLSMHYSRPQKQLEEECAGPYGKTIIQGLLDGEKVYAIFTVEKAVPCCAWYSYSGDDRQVATEVKEWLHPAEVPLIELGNEWYTIGSPNHSYPTDPGPMGGGRFVPTSCSV